MAYGKIISINQEIATKYIIVDSVRRTITRRIKEPRV